MKLFMINLDDNEEDIDVSQPVDFEVEQNKEIGALRDLLYTKYDISRESKLHFAMQGSPKPLMLEDDVQCLEIYHHYVCFFFK